MTKDEILGKVRAALENEDAERLPLPAVFPVTRSALDVQQLVDQFGSEFDRVGGLLNSAASAENVLAYVDKLIPSDEPVTVAVSDRVSALLPELRHHLASRRVKVLPSLREFAESRTPEQLEPGSADGNNDRASLYEAYKRELFGSELGVTTADFAIADTGTLVLLSGERSGPSGSGAAALKRAQAPETEKGNSLGRHNAEQHRLISLVPPTHVCLLDPSKIVPDLATLMHTVREQLYSPSGSPLAMTFITGPSRTADIELSLTMGVHGPKQVHVLLYRMD